MQIKPLIFTVLIALLLGFKSLSAQEIPVYNFKEFEQHLNHQGDSVYFINFWATWCVPCIKEMPAIIKVAQKFSAEPLKIILVSMDFPSKVESSLVPFIRKHNIKSEVIVLDDPDFNSWIDKVDPAWGGGIPATLIYTKNKRSFYQTSFDFEELNTIITTNLNTL